MVKQESLGYQGEGAAGRELSREVIFPQLAELADQAELMKLGFRGSHRDCEYREYNDVETWAKYVAELEFQAFLLKTPNRGCCYIREPLKSTVAPTMSLGFSLGK